MRLIATATFGLEAVVSRELAALGYESKVGRPGWLTFDGDEAAIARTNLWLRASDRVLVKLGRFEARDFGALFDGTTTLAWERLLPGNAHFPVRGRSVKSTLASVPACQSIVKKAIVERLKKAHRVERLPEDGPLFPVEIALFDDVATLAIDTTGPGLHKRGYRPVALEAPLKETLAAGLVLLSFWKPGHPFLDPFCGTGTLPIEAALIGRNRAPGLLRSFAAESWPTLAEELFRRAREEARDLERRDTGEILEGSDRDAEALALAQANAARAGVGSDIRFRRREFASIRSSSTYGCLVSNPPYGDRMGAREEVLELYRSMPDVFRRLPTWSFFILTSLREFESILGQEANRRRKLYNGRIECTYYQFHGPRPHPNRAEPSRPAFGGLSPKAHHQMEIFENRLTKRAHHLRRWPKRRGVEAYRLYERDIKEVPLAVDRFGDCLLVTPIGGRVTSRTPAEQEDWIDEMLRSASRATGIPSERIYVTGRRDKKTRFTVLEHGARFEVHLPGNGSTGLDLDYRDLRQRLRALAEARRVLILGPGGAAFGVAAALGGASEITMVDPRPELHDGARRNLALNGLDEACLRSISSSPSAFLSSESATWDVAFTEMGYGDDWLELLCRRLSADGTAFVISRDPRLRHISVSACRAEELSEKTVPEEFRNRKIHRCWRLFRVDANRVVE
jgi:23S rRNA (guanine2445-N2)-methyltransferase / 23S rRNA (guanine2069-N7)-methyltransferase